MTEKESTKEIRKIVTGYRMLFSNEEIRHAKGGWAPGGYLQNCSDCKLGFLGDKRSYQCAECAYKQE